ncbi:MAG: 4-hydroxythreonine-4-phosphate dehydrogenase PdxA [Clostridia bacterium]|nr:4-hydroxythreonine-4-phosphate dehydrogenase PdxA [Clostridia bacterium]
MNDKPVLGIILGDHAGSSPELAAMTALANDGSYTPVFIGNRERFEMSRSVVKGAEKLSILPLEGRPAFAGAQTVYFSDVPAGKDILYSHVTADSGKLIYDSIARAIELQKEGTIDGICMAPITKEALFTAGYKEDCTEFDVFMHLYGVQKVRAAICGGGIFRCTVVGHCALSEIPSRLTTQGIIDTAESLLGVMRKFMPPEACKIAVAALNPHAGEHGLYGDEEITKIQPAIDVLRERGYDVIGPSPADTVFLKALNKQVAGVVFMYHDQGNIAMKSVFFGDGVLIYTNLPAHIVSVGHGPAYGKAGKGTADPKNMISAMNMLLRIVEHDRGR